MNPYSFDYFIQNVLEECAITRFGYTMANYHAYKKPTILCKCGKSSIYPAIAPTHCTLCWVNKTDCPNCSRIKERCHYMKKCGMLLCSNFGCDNQSSLPTKKPTQCVTCFEKRIQYNEYFYCLHCGFLCEDYCANCYSIRQPKLMGILSWIASYLNVNDVVTCLAVQKTSEEQQKQIWRQLLQRDYPFGFRIAQIEEFCFYEWYKEIKCDQMSIEEYVSIANSEIKDIFTKNTRTEQQNNTIIRCCQKVIAKGEIGNMYSILECLLTMPKENQKIECYLQWARQFVKTHSKTYFPAFPMLYVCKKVCPTRLLFWCKHGIKQKEQDCFEHLFEKNEILIEWDRSSVECLYTLGKQSFPQHVTIITLWYAKQLRDLDDKRCLTVLEELLLAKPDNEALVLFRLARFKIGEEQYKSAYDLYQLALKESFNIRLPIFIKEVLHFIWNTIHHFGEIDKAEVWLKKLQMSALSEKHKNKWYERYASCLLYRKDISSIQIALLSGRLGWSYQVYCFFIEKKYQEAVHYATSLPIKNWDTFGTRYLARCYLQLKQFEIAWKLLVKYQEQNSNASILLEMAYYQISVGNRESAIQYFEQHQLIKDKFEFQLDYTETLHQIQTLLKETI